MAPSVKKLYITDILTCAIHRYTDSINLHACMTHCFNMNQDLSSPSYYISQKLD